MRFTSFGKTGYKLLAREPYNPDLKGTTHNALRHLETIRIQAKNTAAQGGDLRPEGARISQTKYPQVAEIPSARAMTKFSTDGWDRWFNRISTNSEAVTNWIDNDGNELWMGDHR